MPVQNRIPKIQLSADEQTRLSRRLDEQIAQATEFKSREWDSKHEGFWRQYLAQPVNEVKNWPWKNASNLFIPQTQVIIEGILAQEFDAMFGNDPVVKVVGTEETDLETAEILTQYYGEYLYREVIDIKEIGGDLLLDNCVDGTAAAKPRWNRDTTVNRVQSIEEEPVTEKITEEFLGVPIEAERITGIAYRNVESALIETVDEPAIDVSDMSRLYVAPDSGPSLQWPVCRWYYQEQYLTWDDLVERRRKGYDNIDDELKGFLGDRDLTEKERTERAKEGINESTVEETLQVTEHYMRWPLPARYQRPNEPEIKQDEGNEEGYLEEIIATYCPATRKLLRIVPLMRLYPDRKRPHVDHRYHRLPRFFYGLGIPSKMKHINSATNTSFNQWMDNGQLQNIPFYFYEPATVGDMPNMTGLTPGQGIPVLNAGGVQFPRFSNSDNQFWLAALQQLQVWGEKVGTINDFNLGRAPSTPNAPRTASGQSMMLQAGQVAFARLVAMHAARFVELFRRVHALHRKNAKNETFARIFNAERGVYEKLRVPGRLFQREVDFQFVLNPNRVYEQQQAQQLFAMIAPYLMQFNPSGVRTLMKEIWTLNGKKNFDQIWPKDAMPMMQTGGASIGDGAGQSSPLSQAQGIMPPSLPSNVIPMPGMGAPPPMPTLEAPEITPEQENIRL